jgi:replicative DNA helicase
MLNAAKSEIPVGYFSLEMQRNEMIERCLGTIAQVDIFEAHRIGLRADRAGRVDQAQITLNSLPLRLLYRPAMTPRQFRIECRKLVREMGLKFAIVDYFNLMRGDYHSKERWREMMEVILAMKECAGELDIPILLLSQINREGSDDIAPTLSQLRDTGSAEEHSSNVLLLWQKPNRKDEKAHDAEQWDPIEVIIAKQRNGPIGRDIGLKFRKQWGSVIDA